ncbi:MAG: signal peptidase I [Anaerolineae bacterium]|nr:signal peptidase I [Anaerolineae bacterium]
MAETHSLPKPRLRRPGFWRELLNSAFFIFAALVFSELTFPRSSISGSSMEPTLWGGNHLLISRVSYLVADPQFGEIAVFISPDAKAEMLIKRVIGVPGDTIEIRRTSAVDASGFEVYDGEIVRNGVVLDEPYFINRPCNNCYDRTWTLGENEYFFVGDNRNRSNDSRALGPISRERIVGKAIFRYLPFDQFGTLR